MPHFFGLCLGKCLGSLSSKNSGTDLSLRKDLGLLSKVLGMEADGGMCP